MAESKKETKKTYVRLSGKASDGSFTDPETRFELSRQQVAELSGTVGARTASLLAKGVIIKCKPDGTPLVMKVEDDD